MTSPKGSAMEEANAVKITVTMDYTLGEVWVNGRVHFAPQIYGFSMDSEPVRLAGKEDEGKVQDG